MGDRSRLDLLAKLTTSEIGHLTYKIGMLERAVELMQEGMLRMEDSLNQALTDIEALSKKKTRSKK
jgi:hypothetical protein